MVMAGITEKHTQELKDMLEKEHGREFSWEEAEAAGNNLVGLCEILLKCYLEEKRWETRLKKEPGGFALSGNGRNCAICGNSTTEETNWYDKWGIKCLICQEAVDRRKIPGSIAKSRDNRYSSHELEDRFGLKKPTQRAWVKSGLLKARIVSGDSGRVHCYIFLVKDNKGFLPPKELTKPQMVSEERDGKKWHHLEPWYRFGDPHEHLKDYRIMKHLRLIEK